MATDVLSRIRWLAIIYSARAWHNALDGPTAWGARSDTIGGSRRTNVFPSQETRTKTSIAAGGMGATASSEGTMGLDPLFRGQSSGLPVSLAILCTSISRNDFVFQAV